MSETFATAENKMQYLLNNKRAIVLLMIFVWPFGLYLFFRSKLFSKKAKYIAAGIGCVLLIGGYLTYQQKNAEFQQDKAGIIAELENLYEAGEHEKVIRLIERKYSSISDGDLRKIERSARKSLKQQETKQKKMRDRDKIIRRQFSSWDGSHKNVVDAYLKLMYDPSSFDHIETSWVDNGDDISVLMRCRARNRLGGLIIVTVSAKVNIDGKVLSIRESN